MRFDTLQDHEFRRDEWAARERQVPYDTDRSGRISEQPWFECAKCGAHVRESEWLSLCNECGEDEEELPPSLTRQKGDDAHA